jgi:hypothetical protein
MSARLLGSTIRFDAWKTWLTSLLTAIPGTGQSWTKYGKWVRKEERQINRYIRKYGLELSSLIYTMLQKVVCGFVTRAGFIELHG